MPGFSVQEVSEVRRLYDAGTFAQLKVRTSTRKWFFDATFFDELTPGSAWVLGLVFGDGSVAKRGRLLLALGKDEDLCSKVASLLRYEGLYGNSSPDLRADRKFSIFEDL